MAQKPQSFENHARLDPAFHLFMAPVAAILLIGAAVNLARNFGWSSGFHLLAAIWAVVAMFKIRLYALKVQDRVIRLEERLRLQAILAEPMQSSIGKLTEQQLVGLRFASDAEVGDLAQKALASSWSAKDIKQAIKMWRPDYWRV